MKGANSMEECTLMQAKVSKEKTSTQKMKDIGGLSEGVEERRVLTKTPKLKVSEPKVFEDDLLTLFIHMNDEEPSEAKEIAANTCKSPGSLPHDEIPLPKENSSSEPTRKPPPLVKTALSQGHHQIEKNNRDAYNYAQQSAYSQPNIIGLKRSSPLLKRINSLRLINMENVVVEQVNWLWFPYIPFGKLTVLQGDPGNGKTTLTLEITAKVTKGEILPNGHSIAVPINVIFQTAEDGLGDTIKPRLLKA
jgi:hypothetical protein